MMTWAVTTLMVFLAEDSLALPMPSAVAREWGTRLLQHQGGLPPEQVRFPLLLEPNLAQTKGIRRSDGRATLILVPDQNLVGDPNHPSLDQERGSPVGWLLVQGLKPVGLASEKIPRLSLPSGEPAGDFGILQLSARQLGPGEFRLEFWSREERPIYGVDLTHVRRTFAHPIDLEETTGLLTLYGFGHLAAHVPIETVPSAP